MFMASVAFRKEDKGNYQISVSEASNSVNQQSPTQASQLPDTHSGISKQSIMFLLLFVVRSVLVAGYSRKDKRVGGAQTWNT